MLKINCFHYFTIFTKMIINRKKYLITKHQTIYPKNIEQLNTKIRLIHQYEMHQKGWIPTYKVPQNSYHHGSEKT